MVSVVGIPLVAVVPVAPASFSLPFHFSPRAECSAVGEKVAFSSKDATEDEEDPASSSVFLLHRGGEAWAATNGGERASIASAK